jgi:hypothetical protein
VALPSWAERSSAGVLDMYMYLDMDIGPKHSPYIPYILFMDPDSDSDSDPDSDADRAGLGLRP